MTVCSQSAIQWLNIVSVPKNAIEISLSLIVVSKSNTVLARGDKTCFMLTSADHEV